MCSILDVFDNPTSAYENADKIGIFIYTSGGLSNKSILYCKETQPIDDVVWNYDVRNYSKYLIRSTGKHDLNWFMQNTAVLHCCGKNKPWHEDYKNQFGMLYLHYMNLTMRRLYEKPSFLS